MTVRACYINILEGASVTTNSSFIESTSLPLYRIYDRDIGKNFALDASPSTSAQAIINNLNDKMGNSAPTQIVASGWESTSTSIISGSATVGSSSIRLTASTGATSPTTGGITYDIFPGSTNTTAINIKAFNTIRYSMRADAPAGSSTKLYLEFLNSTDFTAYQSTAVMLSIQMANVASTGTWQESSYAITPPLPAGSSAVNQMWIRLGTTLSSVTGSTFYIDNIIGVHASTALSIKVNQGTTIQEIDALIIPSGHGLNGKTLALRYSSDDITYSTALSWTQSGTGAIFSTFTTATMQYWKLVISEPTSANTIPELFLTRTYTFERDPAIPTGQYDNVFNVENIQTASGQDRFLVHGSAKKQRNWSLASMDSTQKANLETLNNAWAGSKPFWVIDESSNLIYGKLQTPINLTYNDAKYWDADFNFIEVLP